MDGLIGRGIFIYGVYIDRIFLIFCKLFKESVTMDLLGLFHYFSNFNTARKTDIIIGGKDNGVVPF